MDKFEKVRILYSSDAALCEHDILCCRATVDGLRGYNALTVDFDDERLRSVFIINIVKDESGYRVEDDMPESENIDRLRHEGKLVFISQKDACSSYATAKLFVASCLMLFEEVANTDLSSVDDVYKKMIGDGSNFITAIHIALFSIRDYLCSTLPSDSHQLIDHMLQLGVDVAKIYARYCLLEEVIVN